MDEIELISIFSAAEPAYAVAESFQELRSRGVRACYPIKVDSDWMSHQNGAVTGTGVEPGAGDSEHGG